MIRLKQKINTVIFSSLAIVLFSQNSFAGSVVITNKATGVDTLTIKEVKALFLKKKKTLPNGAVVVVGDQGEESEIRKTFSKKVLGKSLKKLKRYWSKRVFSGKGTPPKVIGDDSAMKKWVASTPNSLGYIDESAADESVKVLLKP